MWLMFLYKKTRRNYHHTLSQFLKAIPANDTTSRFEPKSFRPLTVATETRLDRFDFMAIMELHQLSTQSRLMHPYPHPPQKTAADLEFASAWMTAFPTMVFQRTLFFLFFPPLLICSNTDATDGLLIVCSAVANSSYATFCTRVLDCRRYGSSGCLLTLPDARGSTTACSLTAWVLVRFP
ncbi:hypothetical protein CEXT_101071 [Caerostris extrusa]|uniref:Uncharacterized protein n=1 Tax=Caerostris extrusa TaxID=172846 RepID=A0AAV4XCN7_CAEEX|nr:hypothetical protein CEXT_101071 [Caerostris extrusa]